MKKPKVSLDTTKLQQFFLKHGEKIVAALCLVVFVYLVYGAATRETFPKTANDLNSTVTRAKQNIEQATWGDAQKAELKITDYAQQAEQVSTPIGEGEDDRLVLNEWFPFQNPLLNLKTKRVQPPLLPVAELEVAAGYGAFEVQGQSGGSGRGTKGYRWAVVTGLIPIKAQKKAFDDTFRGAHDWNAQRDTPEYSDIVVVERAEVTTGADNEDLNWVRIQANTYANTKDTSWTAVSTDVAPDVAIIPYLCYPLAPLSDRRWDASVTHSKIGLATPEKDKEETPAAEVAEAADPAPDAEGEGVDPFSQQNVRPEPAPDAKQKENETAEKAPPPYRLFRYFDFSVEPGKQYRYRVMLGLKNPNYGVQVRYLEDPAQAKRSVLPINFSEPSPVVSIPRNDDLLVGGAKPPAGPREAEALVMLRHWDPESGIDVPQPTTLKRGQLANEVAKEIKGFEEGVEFRADIMLLDVTGGQLLPVDGARIEAPGEALLLGPGPDFRILRRSEIRDAAAYAADSEDVASREEESKEPKKGKDEERPFQ